ncbi:MAG: YhbY family RNA-binding protein [Lachnospiraceae bacterium]|nr:YhbY family RNA-binding protein [Lachnospiraceae bacterium]MBP5528986.1 YhbY family RNA-binding protein [Lachnospiraceae bacterium]
MTSKQRAYLKSLANNLEPLFMVGKSSLTPEFNEAVLEAFNTHELIKLSVLKNCPDNPKELGITIAERTHSELVQVIGKKFILYKPFKDNPVIILPKERKED